MFINKLHVLHPYRNNEVSGGGGGQTSYALWVGYTSLMRAVISDKFSPRGKSPPMESVKGEAWERARETPPVSHELGASQSRSESSLSKTHPLWLVGQHNTLTQQYGSSSPKRWRSVPCAQESHFWENIPNRSLDRGQVANDSKKWINALTVSAKMQAISKDQITLKRLRKLRGVYVMLLLHGP